MNTVINDIIDIMINLITDTIINIIGHNIDIIDKNQKDTVAAEKFIPNPKKIPVNTLKGLLCFITELRSLRSLRRVGGRPWRAASGRILF